MSLPIRVRLTLLYTGLFAACGAIIVATTYTLVAGVPVLSSGEQFAFRFPGGSKAAFLATCAKIRTSPHPDRGLVAKCDEFLRHQGAQSQRDIILSHLLQYSVITLGAVLVLAAVAGWIAAGRALRPVHRITAAARAASEHNLSTRVALRGPRDELRELAETFDDMLARLEAAFEGQRRFIANASHELRTPLAVMRSNVDVALAGPDRSTGELRDMMRDIGVSVDHAERLIGALLTLARNERGLTVRDEVDLATAAEDALDTIPLRGLRVHASLEPAVITGDPLLAERLAANLIDNAARYNVPGGDVWISTSATGGHARLEVANTGPVVDPADVDGLFQPFQRLAARTSRDGSGLGLAIVASIAAVHGGKAAARPRCDGGLSVTVSIPAGRGAAGDAAGRGRRRHSFSVRAPIGTARIVR